MVVNADGSFSYNPPAGFEGADSFTYTVTDPSGQTDTATATFTVNEVVWFVDNAAGPGGDGRLTAPFNSLAPLNGGADPDESFDFIFVHEGAGAYDGGIALEDLQRLIGQGTGLDAALALFSVTAPAHSDTRPAATSRPTLANSGGHVITLANGNSVLHLNASATVASAAAVFGSAAGGTTSVSNVGASASGAALGVSLTNLAGTFLMSSSTVACTSTGAAVLVDGGASSVTFASTAVSQGGGGHVVDVEDRTGGAVTFDAASSVTGTNGTADAVTLLGNNGAVTFAGPVQLNTNAAGARGLVADSGTLNMTNSGNAVSSTGGAAIDLEDLAVNVTIATTFSTNSNGHGVRVNNVSGMGASFGNTAVNGSASTGVWLTNNTASVAFSDLDIAPAPSVRALHATDNTGTLSATSGVISTTGATAVEITAATSTPLNMGLTSVSANGGASGIVLTNTTASSGGFSVNGDGTGARNGSGGTVTATTDDGVRLTNASGVTLRSMNLTNNGDTVSGVLATNESAAGEHAVEAVGSSGLTLSGVLVQSPAASGLLALDLTGTNRVNLDSLFTGINNPQTHGIFLSNSSVNLTLFEINDSDFTNSNTGASMVFVTNGGTADMAVEVENGCIFEGLNSQALTLAPGSTAGTSGTLTSTVNGNTFRNAAGTAENNVGALVNNGAAHVSTIENNLFDNIAEGGLVANTSIIRTQNSGGRMTAVVKGNTVQNINYAAGGRHVIGHIFEPTVFSAANFSDLKFENNTATNVPYTATNREFIHIDYRPTASGGDIKIIGNNWNMPTASSQEGLELRFRQTNASTVDLLMDNNGNGTGAFFNTTSRFLDIDAEAMATVNATVTNNSFTNQNAATTQPMIDFASEGTTSAMCVNVSGNTLVGNPAATNTLTLNEAAGTTMNVTQASAAAVSAANGGATVNVIGAPAFGQPACALPMNAALEMPAGFSADRDFVASQPALDKTGRGLAHTERGLLLGSDGLFDLVAAQPEAETPAAESLVVETLRAAPAAAPLVTLAGETVNIPVGTLRAGDSVTITFQVTVADPFPAIVQPPQVSNQGTVTADGGISVLTDDPTEPGAADPTVTPILTPPTININDATVTEPASGSADALFTVTLSHPFSQTVTVNFQTANGGANPATAGTDYTITNGTATFNAGETVPGAQAASAAAFCSANGGAAPAGYFVVGP